MKNPTGTKNGKYGFRLGGGINHVRYDHRSRPAKIDIVCPACGQRAQAIDVKANPKYRFVGDMSWQWIQAPFDVVCTKCLYRASDQSFDELGEPYFQFSGRGGILWAWNYSHLDMIRKYLSGRSIKGHEFEFYSTYIHGAWKRYKESYINKINKALNNA